MRLLVAEDFNNKNFYNEAELASYTAERDMAVTCRVLALNASGTLTLKPKIDGRTVGPTMDWTRMGAKIMCNAWVFALILKSGQEFTVHVKSTDMYDLAVDGTVYIAEQDTPTADVYSPVIERLRDDGAAIPADRWSVLWQKNGVTLTSGVTSPTLTVRQRSDAAALFSDQALTAVGSSGAFKYDATGAERPAAGESLIATAAATIDGAARSSPGVIVKDHTR